jgi:outer membrane protein assembly factor BamD (BamD/ComL family)
MRASAFETTELHGRRFPKGRLAEERESVAIQALVRLERHEEARRRASDFERRYPTSVFLPVIGRALRSIP